MKRPVLLMILVSILGGVSKARMLNEETSIAGCLDCFNFVASTIFGAENVSLAEMELVVYDSSNSVFRGYNGEWNTLTKENRVRSTSSTTTTITVSVTADDMIIATSSSATTVNLPDVVLVPDKEYLIKKTNSTFNVITILGSSPGAIYGASSKKLASFSVSIGDWEG